MARKRHSDEEVLKLLREIELTLTAGDDGAFRAVGREFFRIAVISQASGRAAAPQIRFEPNADHGGGLRQVRLVDQF